MTSAALRIARQKLGSAIAAAWNFLSGRLPDGLTFSRASGGTVFAPARYGDELVVNGTFNTDTSGWTANGNTVLSIVSGRLSVQKNTTGGSASQAVTTTPGRTYRLSWRATTVTNAPYVYLGTNPGDQSVMAGNGVSGVDLSFTFVATAASVTITLGTNVGNNGNTVEYDNVSFQELTIWRPGMDWLGPELVTNGDAASGLTGWTTSGTSASLTLVNGAFRIANGAAAEAGALPSGGAQIQAGRVYQVLCDLVQAEGTGGVYVVLANAAVAMGVIPGPKSGTVTAASAGSIRVAVGTATAGNAATFDNLSVREQLYTFQQVLLPANVPRFGYDPLTLAPLGLLIEPQRTNRALWSDDLSQAGTWLKEGGAVSRPTILGPRGLTPTNLFTPDTSSGLHRVLQSTISVTNGMSDGFQVALKANGVRYIYCNAQAGWGKQICVDLQTGAVIGPATVKSSPNGWWLIKFSGVGVNVGSSAIFFQANSVFAATDAAWTPNGTDGFYVDCIGVEAGTEATSYIPTAGAAATRAADNPDGPTNCAGATEATFVVEFMQLGAVSGAMSLLSASTTPTLAFNNAGNGVKASMPGVVDVVSTGATLLGQGVVQKAAASFKTGAFAVTANGAVPTLSASAQAVSVASSLSLGREANVAPLYVRLVRIVARKCSDTELQALTR